MQFLGTPTTCVSCHQVNYNVAPNHVASRYPTTCDGCHTTVTWNAANLGAANHPVAPIALTGVHSANLINCTQCHTTTPYSSVQTACVACHQAAYNGAKDPDHVAAKFSTDVYGLSRTRGRLARREVRPPDRSRGPHRGAQLRTW